MAEKHQKKKKGSALKILLAVLLLLVLTVGVAGVFAYNEINGNGGKPGAEVTVSIPQGSGCWTTQSPTSLRRWAAARCISSASTPWSSRQCPGT